MSNNYYFIDGKRIIGYHLFGVWSNLVDIRRKENINVLVITVSCNNDEDNRNLKNIHISKLRVLIILSISMLKLT